MSEGASWRVAAEQQVAAGLRRAQLEQDADPTSLTRGCADRRHWAWKLVDMPEATFQRCAYPLAWAASRIEGQGGEALRSRARWALAYSARIQRADGSFDQAFPFERSFGATAFLLADSLRAVELLGESPELEVDASLRKAAEFLCRADEGHGEITNHIAGAVWALLLAGERYAEPRYRARGEELLARILSSQSSEGWFPEDGGADPGYQSLCLTYLVQVQRRWPRPGLARAVARVVELLACCVHPDGSFAGEYGSRRTAILYPGGLALLAEELPLAGAIVSRVLASERLLGPAEVDVGNLFALLGSYLPALEASPGSAVTLPCDREDFQAEFSSAGLVFRSTGSYYAVLGTASGGLLKVFGRDGAVLWEDSGYAGVLTGHGAVTSQDYRLDRRVDRSVELGDSVTVRVPFVQLKQHVPTPAAFLALRALNLTALRSRRLVEWLKRALAKALVGGGQTVPLELIRRVTFSPDAVDVEDRLLVGATERVEQLGIERRFVSVHMASARYYDTPAALAVTAPQVDLVTLERARTAVHRIRIEAPGA